MQGDPRIIDLPNQVLRKELTGINQYFIHSAILPSSTPPSPSCAPAYPLSLEIGDHGTRDLLERIVVDEEHHIGWIEAQRHKIAEVGYQQYLAQRIYA